jgi:hypothetical protein
MQKIEDSWCLIDTLALCFERWSEACLPPMLERGRYTPFSQRSP